MRRVVHLIINLIFLSAPALAQAPPQAPPPAAQATAQLTDERIDQLMAPIALYPDALLAQVLMAATYPDQVAEAATWSKEHPQLKGDDAVKQVASQPWDPSVQSLVAFPQVLATLAEKPQWVADLGAAFLAQPDAVMSSVQRLRSLAQESGNLISNEQQQVAVEEVAPEQTIIRIEPATPEVVYVPSYNPTVVYGAWPYPAYPPVYIPPPYGYGIVAGVATGLAFGVGVGVTSALWGGFRWGGYGHNDIDINVNRYNSVNVNRQLSANQNSWTRNNQARINNAKTRTNYKQTAPRQNARGPQAQQKAQNAQREQARQKAQNAQRGQAQPKAQGAQKGQARPKAQSGQRKQAPKQTPKKAPSSGGRRGGRGGTD